MTAPYSLFPHLTIFENIAFPLRMRKRPQAEIRERVTDALDLVQLPQIADRFPTQLSGGQQQRVALARAIVYEPSIVLMDEPLGALDRRTREAMQLEMRQLHHRLGITLLWVTHDQEEALVVSDRVCVMNHAKIEQVASPDSIYFRPTNRFVANFLGDSVIFGGKLKTSADGWTVETDFGDISASEVPDNAGLDSSVDIMVRPEHMKLVGDPSADAGTGQNRISGKVRDIVFLGPITRVIVEAEANQTIEAKLLSERFQKGIREGASVTLSWNVDDSVVMNRT